MQLVEVPEQVRQLLLHTSHLLLLLTKWWYWSVQFVQTFEFQNRYLSVGQLRQLVGFGTQVRQLESQG